MRTRLLVDSGADLNQQYLNDYSIGFLPFVYKINDIEFYSDWKSNSPEALEQLITDNKLKVSRPPLGDWYNIINSELNDYDRFIYLSLSQKTTSCLGTFHLIKQMVEEENPGKQLIGINSLTASSAYSLLALYASQNLDPVEIEKKTSSTIFLCFPDDMTSYKRIARGVIKDEKDEDKYILTFDEQGFFRPKHKYTDYSEALDYAISELKNYNRFFISYSFSKQNNEYVSFLRDKFKDRIAGEAYMSPSCQVTVGPAFTIAGII